MHSAFEICTIYICYSFTWLGLATKTSSETKCPVPFLYQMCGGVLCKMWYPGCCVFGPVIQLQTEPDMALDSTAHVCVF